MEFLHRSTGYIVSKHDFRSHRTNIRFRLNTNTAAERGMLPVVVEVAVRNFERSVVWNML
jgi:hypothetical protein